MIGQTVRMLNKEIHIWLLGTTNIITEARRTIRCNRVIIKPLTENQNLLTLLLSQTNLDIPVVDVLLQHDVQQKPVTTKSNRTKHPRLPATTPV